MTTKSADDLNGSEPREEAIPLLLDAHGGRLYSMGVRLCGNRADAQDLVQETFLQAFRKWHQFEGRSRPSTWLYTIASRTCRRFHRKKSGEPERMESLEELLPLGGPRLGTVPKDGDGPLSSQIREEARAKVEAAISSLPYTFRWPFVLKEIAGFSLAEIATILNLREATVKTRIHRARLRVRKTLERALPRSELPPPIFSKEICLDLLRAKLECLDRGLVFQFPDQVVCERCAAIFATLDLEQGICRDIARGDLPEKLRKELLTSVRP